MSKRKALIGLTLLALVGGAGWTLVEPVGTGTQMTEAAGDYLGTLTDEQKATSLMSYDTPKRVGWHFIPKDERKGLQIKNMDEKQRAAAFHLLETALSEVGYDKAKKIMALEGVLNALEGGKGRNIRDTERYYYTVFGEPSDQGSWGLSIEGHHLSLNFVVKDGKVASSTPTFFAANPTVIKKNMPGGLKKGLRVLAKEEALAFKLVKSLDDEQRKAAILDDTAPKEIRAAGEAECPPYAEDGLCFAKLEKPQQKTVRALIAAYAENLPDDVSGDRIRAIKKAGLDKVYFAWAGPDKPGIGHYYRLQGPTFLIEFVNTQPDAAGNPASHIHCVWRDPNGDFDIPVESASGA